MANCVYCESDYSDERAELGYDYCLGDKCQQLGMSKSKQEFLEEYNYAPYDDIELAKIASKIEGEIGLKAKKFLSSLDLFNKTLEEIGYERG